MVEWRCTTLRGPQLVMHSYNLRPKWLWSLNQLHARESWFLNWVRQGEKQQSLKPHGADDDSRCCWFWHQLPQSELSQCNIWVQLFGKSGFSVLSFLLLSKRTFPFKGKFCSIVLKSIPRWSLGLSLFFSTSFKHELPQTPTEVTLCKKNASSGLCCW